MEETRAKVVSRVFFCLSRESEKHKSKQLEICTECTEDMELGILY